MAKSNLKHKLDQLSKDRQQEFLDELNWRQENRGWLDRSFAIAGLVLRTLRQRGMTQAELADQLGVSRQWVSKLVKGRENLSLKTIDQLEQALGVTLIEVPGMAEARRKAGEQTAAAEDQAQL
jgi:ribosome-binding protein aMBF1 (putative translation factor)